VTMNGDPHVNTVDVLFVGGGVSSSYTLLALLDELAQRPPSRPVRTVVVEQTRAEYGGVPYGSRSGSVSLIITSLQDFLPDAERLPFIEWLSENKAALLDEISQAPGPNTQRWLTDHAAAIACDDWAPLYVPRMFFGRYIDQRVRGAVTSAEAAGIVEHQIVHAEVTKVERVGNAYSVTSSDSSASWTTTSIVLGIGSMPLQQRFDGLQIADVALIDDLYVPNLATNVERVRQAVARIARPKILVLGSNASALETLYVLNDVDDPAMASAEFIVMSPGGAFPERTTPPTPGVQVATPELDRLGAHDAAFSAEELYLGARRDLASISAAGQTVTESLPVTSPAIGRAVSKLDPDEKRKFAERWGVELGKHQRRAGVEYSQNVEQLRAAGRLAMLPAAFDSIAESTSEGVRVRYYRTGELVTSDQAYAAVINCAGFSSTAQPTRSTLVTDLIASGLCVPVSTGCGVEVNDQMEAAPNLFVMGPLLAGNVVNNMAIWHVEHCGRIAQFSKGLARIVADSIVASVI
jgi:uncharacterized NAD(P)/FAD-binding protein YdhS